MKRVFSLPERTHGSGPIFFTWQKKSANYLVTTGYDHSLNIFDRHGDKVEHVNLPGFCSGLAWDSEGEMLGLITDRSPSVILWDSNTHKVSRIDTGVRDALTLILWAKGSAMLAVGTSKGNLLIYNHRTSRKIPILGKHNKRITSGAWSEQNLLALVGEERVMTISNEEGDTICSSSLKGDATLVQFAVLKIEGRGNPNNTENCVSAIINRKILYLLNIHDSENPFVFSFNEKYGQIVDYQWFGEGQILMGFSFGYFTIISTQAKEIGEELKVIKAHKECLSTIALCMKTKTLASCCENTIKMYDLQDLDEVREVITIDDEKNIEWMEWSEEGQMLAIASSTGSLHVYLAKLAIVGGSYGTQLAYLSSLLEVSVVSASDDLTENAVVIRVNVEPSLVAIGPYHMAVAMNNRVWFYALTGLEQHLLLKEKEYIGIVKGLKLNGDYAAVLFTDGKLFLHLIENNERNSINEEVDDREARTFPDGQIGEKGRITAMSITNDFLVYATDGGSIEFFMLEDWAMVNIYRHSVGIKLFETDPHGLRLVALDEHNEAFVYNSVTDVVIQVTGEEFPTSAKSLFWETYLLDKGVFIACDNKHAYIYVSNWDTIEGPSVEYVSKMKIPTGQYPLVLYNGVLVCQTQSGKMSSFVLSTHDYADHMTNKSKLKSELFEGILKLRRFQDAWKICEYLADMECWVLFGRATMFDLDIEQAIKVFRHVSDPGMVLSLIGIKDIEERNLLAANLAMFLDKYDLAQQLFLSSTRPEEALEMRQNIQDWDTALVLAKRLAPHAIPIICREYATQLEFAADYHSALDNFERAVINNPEEYGLERGGVKVQRHNDLCKGGIARNAIRCGNTKRGIEFATQLKKDPELHVECASILESMKLYSDAAALYELGEDFEKAASLFLRVKNTGKVSDFVDKVSSTDILIQFAKAKESEGKFKDAVKAYHRANDYINVVRILLEKLNNPGEAVKLVKETKSTEGAKMVARFFQKLNDMSSAIEFLVLSKCNDEAFQLASSTGQMDIYANVLLDIVNNTKGEEVALSDFQSIAIFYEQEKSPLMAGKFYCFSQNYKKGVKLLLQSASVSTNEGEAIKLAIDAASKCKEEQVIRQVIDYLIGETDGVPKDFKYLFRLYMSLKQFREAGKTAIIIAREEQIAGNYRNSHDLLFGMCQELRKQRIRVPSEMNSSLMLIHSYLLAKTWVKIGDHIKSAQLLIRVAKNISRFPAHTVPILTSTVIECQRAGYKKHSIQYASLLMKPEYRELIDPKFKKKIETLVRKSAGAIRSQQNVELDAGGLSSPCPYCDQELVETELNCNSCRNAIPFCIATGHHLVREDLTACPNCTFPAILTQMIRLLEKETSCPMCSHSLDQTELFPLSPESVHSVFHSEDNEN